MIKSCPRCKTDKPSTEYYTNRRDGTASYCKTCSAATKRKGERTRDQVRADVFPTEGRKRCSKCAETMPIAQFGRRRGDQYNAACRSCRTAQHKAWLSKSTNGARGVLTRKELAARLQAAIYPSPHTRVCSKCKLALPREAFGQTKGVFRHRCKACRSIEEQARYRRQKDAASAKRAAYREANIEVVREWARNGFKRRRAAKQGVETTLTAAEWQEILARHEGRCLRCGTQEDISMDHVVPISKGGAHAAANVQPLCCRCNSSKGTKTIDYRQGA